MSAAREASGELSVDQYLLRPGYIYLPDVPTAISVVLGSGVAVCLYDRRRKCGGMNHFTWPMARDKQRTTASYGNVATIALIRLLIEDGSKRENLVAQIVGGAFNPEVSPRDIGRENVRVARRCLLRKRIRIVSEDVGGGYGRKVVYNGQTNEMVVLKVERIRKGDWFPYEDDR